MAVTVFGYLILISIDFYDFISPFFHSRQCLTTLPNTSKTQLNEINFCEHKKKHLHLFSSLISCNKVAYFELVVISSASDV